MCIRDSLASFQAVLTLPGIAGMVLTLGMAVDANVLIYSRNSNDGRDKPGEPLPIILRSSFDLHVG